MSNLSKVFAAFLALPAIALAPSVYATAAGQIEGGNIYRIKNITKNVDFTDPASADACNELMYKVRLHNPGPSPIHDVNVKATLPAGVASSHTSTLTTFSPDAYPHYTSDTAVVNISSPQSLSYVTGSTQLLDDEGNFVQTLGDGIVTGNGVNIGNIGVSIQEKRFVQFKVKISCPEVPKPVYSCDSLDVKVGEKRKVDAKVTYTAKDGANLTNVGFKWGDGNLTNAGTSTSASHTYAKDGTYNIVATLTFDVGGAVKADTCTKSVTVSTPVPPVVLPETTLPKTGPGAAASVFVGASALGTIGHLLYRRFGL